MNCLRNLRNLVLRFDLFAAPPTLRVNGETDYEHTCCGAFSILLILAFIGIFAQQIIDVLNKAQIEASVQIDDQTNDENSITDIRFALGIHKVNLQDTLQYFSIELNMMQRTPENPKGLGTPIHLQLCTEETWNSYGENFQDYFQAYRIHQLYCVPDDANVSLLGYQGSDTQYYLQLRVKQCHSRPDCANASALQSYINDHVLEEDYFNVRLLFVDTLISPSDSEVTHKTLEKDIFLTFGKTTGTRGKITLGRYSIETDESIWPFEVIQTEQGHYIESFQTNSIQLNSDHYVVMQISKSTLVYTVERFHKKIDDLLSYIGGLFALVFVVIFFFLAPFNQYRYELMVAEHSFSYDEHGKKVRQNDLTIWMYVKYAFYDMVKMLGCNLDWEDMKKIDAAREEANQQLDVKTIMKKLRHFQRITSLLMDQYLIVSSQIMKPLTIEESRRKRKILQYYDKIMQNKLTDDEFDNVYNVLGLSTKKNQLPIASLRKEDTYDELTKGKDQKQKQTEEVETEKKCECKIDEEYDEDDEEAQKYIYDMYIRLKTDSSPRAEEILSKIPKYIRMRMDGKMNDQRGMSFIDLGLS